MKRLSVVGLLVLLLFIQGAGVGVGLAAGPVYEGVVVRGSLAPLDWHSNIHGMVWNDDEEVWLSEPISLAGGVRLEFKYVYDGEWMPGSNLQYTPRYTAPYVFAFHPGEERRVDLRLAADFEASVVLQVTLPEDTPLWAVPTIGSNLNQFNYTLLTMDRDDDRQFSLIIPGDPGQPMEYFYALGDERFREVRSEPRRVVLSADNPRIEDTVQAWQALPVAERVSHEYQISPAVPAPDDDIQVVVRVEHFGPVDSGAIYFTTDGTRPEGQRGAASSGEVVLLELRLAGTRSGLTTSRFVGVIPALGEPGRLKYVIDVWNSEGSGSQFADTNGMVPEDAAEFGVYVDWFQSPDWAKDAVIYHVFVDRFRDGDPSRNEPSTPLMSWDEQLMHWMGGDLIGVEQSLDYIVDLGFNTIWLSPVYEGPYFHGYHPTNFVGIDQRFGDEEILRSLVQEAQMLGLRVIYDFVPNHSSSQHPFFQDAVARGTLSPYYNWYSFTNWPYEYATFYGIGELPQFNNEYAPARQYMLDEVVPFWLLDMGFDGFRLDYAKGPSRSFWTDFRYQVKSLDAEYYIFGEIWDAMDVIASYAGYLDGALDFGFRSTMVDVFIEGRSLQELSRHVRSMLKHYPEEYVMTTFLDNHDLPRFLFLADDDTQVLRMAAAAQFALPGSPVVYYGTEVGLSQSRHHDEVLHWKDRYYREPMLWDETEQDAELAAFYRALLGIYHEHAALRRGDYEEFYVDRDLLVFRRSWDQESVLAIINKSSETAEYYFQADGFRHLESLLAASAVEAGEAGWILSVPPRTTDLFSLH